MPNTYQVTCILSVGECMCSHAQYIKKRESQILGYRHHPHTNTQHVMV